MDLNPDILAQQDKNHDNPHKTKHIDLNDKALGRSGGSSRYNSDDSIGMTKSLSMTNFILMSLELATVVLVLLLVLKMNTRNLKHGEYAKGQLVATHQSWVDSITKQCDQLKIGLKAYRYSK